jgi:hypothetical protein
MTRHTDPLRAEVEATLRRVVSSGLALPCSVVRAAQRTGGEVLAIARAMFNVTTDGVLGWDVDAGVPRLDPTVTPSSAPAATATGSRGARLGDAQQAVDAPPSGAVHLAIQGYEDLAASHIVARLGRLDRDELRDIREFEVANRGRRTVVAKIDQLLTQR